VFVEHILSCYMVQRYLVQRCRHPVLARTCRDSENPLYVVVAVSLLIQLNEQANYSEKLYSQLPA